MRSPRAFISLRVLGALVAGCSSMGWAQAQVTCPDLEGDFQPGGLLWGQVTSDILLEFNDVVVPVLDNGTFLIGLGRDAPPVLELKTGAALDCIVDVKPRQYRISRVEGVPQRTVTPSQEQLARIRVERERVRSAKAQRLQRPEFLEAVKAGLKWPVTGRISGVYGSQRYFNGEPRRPHFGLDIANKTGSPVYAPISGTVVFAEPDLYYSGGTLIIDHGHGITSTYIHLSKLDVKVGDKIEQGNKVAEIGATGRVTGPHLDWRFNWKGERLDPALLMQDTLANKK